MIFTMQIMNRYLVIFTVFFFKWQVENCSRNPLQRRWKLKCLIPKWAKCWNFFSNSTFYNEIMRLKNIVLEIFDELVNKKNGNQLFWNHRSGSVRFSLFLKFHILALSTLWNLTLQFRYISWYLLLFVYSNFYHNLQTILISSFK